ncbi:MAG: glycosyltransferase family 1 protein [Snowella sp.]|nr:glycosyltransferase family 1 protein [Snowella sp.]
MNILTYVHLRSIHNSTGAGRVARQMVEHLHQNVDARLCILADHRDYKKIISKMDEPWSSFSYSFFKHDTSFQQKYWALTHNPSAEQFWPDTHIVYCTTESYVPVKKARLVVTLHDAAYFEDNAHVKNRSFLAQRLKWKYLYWILSRKADLFHTVSNFSAERLAHFFPQISSRLRVIPNAVPPRFFLPCSDEGNNFVESLGLIDQPFILLPTGLHYRKNADLILQAWAILSKRMPDLKLVVTSYCDPSYVKKAQGIGDSIMMTGFVSDEALCSLYHAAQLVWFPSIYEGFGIPVLEAMACGTPVIASNSSSLPEIAGNAAVLVSNNSIDDYIESIVTLLNNAQLREDLSQRGKERASKFTWQQSATELYQHFLSIL